MLYIRNHRIIVDEQGVLLIDYPFASDSTAAHFVMGRSRISNSYVAWRVNEHINPKSFEGK